MVSASETRGALEGCRLVLLRVVVGLVSRDAASGPWATRPSDSCLGCLAGCVGWGVVLRHFVSGTPRCRKRIVAKGFGGVEARSCWRRGRRGLLLHLLGNDGGQRRARGMIFRERSVVLRGATSSTRFVARGGDAAGGEV